MRLDEMEKLQRAVADPEPELDRLTSVEKMNIKSNCQTGPRSAVAYRQCDWQELRQLGVNP